MKNKQFFWLGLGLLLALSATLNVYLYRSAINTRNDLAILHLNPDATFLSLDKTVAWLDQNHFDEEDFDRQLQSLVAIEGASIFLNIKDNLKDGYEFVSAKIQKPFNSQTLQCEVTEAMVLGSAVGGFKRIRDCEVTSFDLDKQLASFKTKGIVYSINRNAVSWQTPKHTGSLAPVTDYVLNFKKYH